MRRLSAVALAIPLMTAGVILAHWIAYLVAVPDAGSRRALLAASGHAYVAWVPMLLGVTAAVAVLLLACLALRGGTSLAHARLRPRAFVVLPPVAFAVQEHAERLRVGYDTPWHVWQEPTFLRGLLLQLPFGLLAYAIAALVLRVSRAVQALVERRRTARPFAPWRAPRVPRPSAAALLRAVPVRAGDALSFRGPPAALLGSR